MREWITPWALAAVCVIAPAACADGPGDIRWRTVLESTADGVCHAMTATDTGGYVVVGSVPRRTVASLYIAIVDADGRVVVERTVGNDVEVISGQSVARCPDGGYVIAGSRMSHAEMTARDLYLGKINADAVPQWQVTSGGALDDASRCVICTSDGGYAVAGESFSFGPYKMQVYLVRFDASGRRLWQKTYGGYLNDQALSLCETADGGFLLAGRTQSLGDQRDDVYLIRTDAAGGLLWQHALGGAGADSACHVEPTSDGGYIVAGTITPVPALDSDFYVVKLDAAFAIQWTNTYDAGDMETCQGLRRCRGGGYVLVGTKGTGMAADAWVVRIDSAGTRLWDAVCGGSAADSAVGILRCSDTGCTILGNTNSFGGFDRSAGYLTHTAPDVIAPADFDFNGAVNLFDFAIFAATWRAEPRQAGYNADCDIALDGDPVVNAADMAEFARHYLTER